MKILATLAFVLFASIASAQSQAPVQGVTAEAPALTELEKAKLETAAVLATTQELIDELAQTRQMLAQFMVRLNQYEPKAQKEIGSKYLADLVAEIEKSRPGFKFNPRDGSFSPIAK